MRLMKLFLSIVYLVCYCASSIAQNKVSLLVAEYDENSSVDHLQHLVKYIFENGRMVAKDPIVTVPIVQSKDPNAAYVRFDIGKSRIYRNRYLITGIGNIIDLKNKKILFDKNEPVVGIEGDSIIYYTNDLFKGKYYSIYNLKTEKYFKVENANYNPYPTPDIEVGIFTQPFTISYYDNLGKKIVLVNDAGYGEANIENNKKAKQVPPVFWTDDKKKSFLYANFSKDQKAATIYKVGLNKTVEKIAVIDAIPPSKANTYFDVDPAGNIVYSCAKGRYTIDIRNKKATKIEYENIGNDFLIEADENDIHGRIVKYKNVEIGKKWCRYDNAKTTTNFIAIDHDMVLGGERYSQGVAVWSTSANKWSRLKMFELATIIGWINE